ncbi:hypothetical protein GCM10010321_15170 [Streptomyces chartreusis]|nr:hypothetical protein GCM10010321_15170 [Streptomyces chartreusis]
MAYEPHDDCPVSLRGGGLARRRRQEGEWHMSRTTTVPRSSAEAASRGDGDRKVGVK